NSNALATQSINNDKQSPLYFTQQFISRLIIIKPRILGNHLPGIQKCSNCVRKIKPTLDKTKEAFRIIPFEFQFHDSSEDDQHQWGKKPPMDDTHREAEALSSVTQTAMTACTCALFAQGLERLVWGRRFTGK